MKIGEPVLVADEKKNKYSSPHDFISQIRLVNNESVTCRWKLLVESMIERSLSVGVLKIGLTIASQNDYCDIITIVKNPIAILLQLPIAILLR